MISSNPIYKRDARTSIKTARTVVFIVGFNLILATVAFTMLHNTIDGIKSMGAVNYSGFISLYTVMAYIEFGIVALIVPTISAGSIVGEKEHQTLDVMLASRIHPITIIWGKILACVEIVIAVCVSSLPVLSIVYAYGGMKFSNILVLIAVIICTGFYFGSIGILTSCLCKKTTTAVMLAYVSIVAIVFITGGIIYVTEKISTYLWIDSKVLMDGVSKIMLFNPAATVVDLVDEQLETTNNIKQLLFYGFEHDNEEVITNWTQNSLTAQLITSTIILFISAWILNPLKFGLWRKVKKIYGKRKSKKESFTD